MRRIIHALGIVALIFLALVAISVGVVVALNAESKNYIDGAVPAIVRHWSKDDLIERATPELLAMAKPGQMTDLFSASSRLGTMIEYQGAIGGASVSYLWKTGLQVSAAYLVKAQFENGPATFRVALLRQHGQWRIHGFHVNFEPGQRTRQGA